MEEHRYWKTQDSLLWFAIAFPIVVIPFQWLCWRKAQFSLRETTKGCGVKNRFTPHSIAGLLFLFQR
jgi:hypothetical protein